MEFDVIPTNNWVASADAGPKIPPQSIDQLPNPSVTEQESAKHKRQNGVYYTPAVVARTLTEWAIRSRSDTILEPSFGGCAFLEACLNQLKSVGCSHPEAQLSGYDVDPAAFTHLLELSPDLYHSGRFVLGDFLAAEENEIIRQKVNIVLGNPPFVPYRKMNFSQRKALDRWISENRSFVQKDASLWAYFLQNSLKFLHENGRMAWVLPSALLFVEYGESLLELLRSHFKTTTVIDIQEQLFVSTGTRERTILLLCDEYSSKPSTNGKRSVIQVTRFQDWEESFKAPTSQLTLQHSIQPNIPLNHAYDLVSTCLSNINYLTLGDISKVLIGDVVGDTAFFVKTLKQWEEIGIPRDYLKPLLSKSSFFYGCHLTRAKLEKLIQSTHRCLLLHPPKESIPTEIQKYLDTYNINRREDNATFNRRHPWYRSTYDATSDIFYPSVSTAGPRMIVNACNIACSNSLYRIKLDPAWNAQKYALAIFNASSFSQLVAELVGGTMGEGALKLNPLHLKQLPIFSALTDLGPTAYPVFRRMDHFMQMGQEEIARTLADSWLAPLLTEKMNSSLATVLAALRYRRKNYKCTGILN